MPYLLRALKKLALWAGPVSPEAPGDCVGDFVPKGQVLSLWEVDDLCININTVLLEICAGRDHVGGFDYALADKAVLASSFNVQQVDEFPFQETARGLHFCVSGLTVRTVCRLVETFYSARRIGWKAGSEVAQILRLAVDEGQLDPSRLKGGLRRGLGLQP